MVLEYIWVDVLFFAGRTTFESKASKGGFGGFLADNWKNTFHHKISVATSWLSFLQYSALVLDGRFMGWTWFVIWLHKGYKVAQKELFCYRYSTIINSANK